MELRRLQARAEEGAKARADLMDHEALVVSGAAREGKEELVGGQPNELAASGDHRREDAYDVLAQAIGIQPASVSGKRRRDLGYVQFHEENEALLGGGVGEYLAEAGAEITPRLSRTVRLDDRSRPANERRGDKCRLLNAANCLCGNRDQRRRASDEKKGYYLAADDKGEEKKILDETELPRREIGLKGNELFSSEDRHVALGRAGEGEDELLRYSQAMLGRPVESRERPRAEDAIAPVGEEKRPLFYSVGFLVEAEELSAEIEPRFKLSDFIAERGRCCYRRWA